MANERIFIDDSLFPLEDGISYEVVDGIDPTYDLRQFMSQTVKSRLHWDDFAKITSKILYEAIERHRVALSLARTPENLSRVLKILVLKMLGLDYRSDLLRDGDYDRALNTISLYNKTTKGKDAFVKYMGFIKDAKFELAHLWTQDYVEFVDGPAIGWETVYDSPPGNWFPTTHVGLLYEEFTNNTPIDEEDLKSLFYRMAPINLVLDWIAGMMTARIGTLYLQMHMWEQTEDTMQVIFENAIHIYFYTGVVETTEDTQRTFPIGLPSRVYIGPTLHVNETSYEQMQVSRGAIDWSAATLNVPQSFNNSALVENVLARNVFGVYEGRVAPVFDEYDDTGRLLGEQLIPERLNSVPGSNDPTGASYVRTNVTPGPLGYTALDKQPLRLVTVTDRGTIKTTTLPTATSAVTFIYKPTTSLFTAIERGSDRVVINNTTLALTKTGGFWAESELLSDGLIRVSALMTGKDITVYPCWGTTTGGSPSAAGAIYWKRLVEEDAIYPSRAITTLNGLPRIHPSTRWTIPGEQLNYDSGFFFLDFTIPYAEWTAGLLHLFEFIGSRSRFYANIDTGGIVRVGVLNEQYRHEIPDLPSGNPPALVAKARNKLCVSWDTSNRRMSVYLNGVTMTRNDIDWPANFMHGGICRTDAENVKFTSYVRRFSITGLESNTLLPTSAALLHLAT